MIAVSDIELLVIVLRIISTILAGLAIMPCQFQFAFPFFLQKMIFPALPKVSETRFLSAGNTQY